MKGIPLGRYGEPEEVFTKFDLLEASPTPPLAASGLSPLTVLNFNPVALRLPSSPSLRNATELVLVLHVDRQNSPPMDMPPMCSP